MTISFIGSAGVPNRYGGFESFLEHCGPAIASCGVRVVVTCDSRLYPDQNPDFIGVHRLFLTVPANGVLSVLHDAIAFLRVFHQSDQIVVLGVSGGLWFPLFRFFCAIGHKRLILNVDGLEWRRTKFSLSKRLMLKFFDSLAQRFAHRVIYDNEGLYKYLTVSASKKSTCIAYPGDHVLRLQSVARKPQTALTVCRIEPENNLDLLIEGALRSRISEYTIIGNWKHSEYARLLWEKYSSNPKLRLMDSVYDPIKLAEFRESCDFYLHGHSVGGTNPSLVEMLFYDCNIICFDVEFNRYTAGQTAIFFRTAIDLQRAIDGPIPNVVDRLNLRAKYKAEVIANKYLQFICS
jgi:glycosyltransferase involved in cell wall biosynthesis